MKQCEGRATLVITANVTGTSTSLARRRVSLRCHLSEGHVGPHQDTEHAEQWEGDQPKTLLRSEDDD